MSEGVHIQQGDQQARRLALVTLIVLTRFCRVALNRQADELSKQSTSSCIVVSASKAYLAKNSLLSNPSSLFQVNGTLVVSS